MGAPLRADTRIGLVNSIALVAGAVTGVITYMKRWDEIFVAVRESVEFLANRVSTFG